MTATRARPKRDTSIAAVADNGGEVVAVFDPVAVIAEGDAKVRAAMSTLEGNGVLAADTNGSLDLASPQFSDDQTLLAGAWTGTFSADFEGAQAKKTAPFDHESLAIDRVALARESRLDAEPCRTAQVLTSSGRLLRGLTAERDIAATLLAASTRAGADPAAVGQLRVMVGTQGIDALLATAEANNDRGHTGAVTTVARSDALVPGGEDGAVRIWDLTGAQPVRERRGHAGSVYTMAISPDRQAIAYAGEDAAIRLWRLETGESTGVLTGHL